MRVLELSGTNSPRACPPTPTLQLAEEGRRIRSPLAFKTEISNRPFGCLSPEIDTLRRVAVITRDVIERGQVARTIVIKLGVAGLSGGGRASPPGRLSLDARVDILPLRPRGTARREKQRRYRHTRDTTSRRYR